AEACRSMRQQGEDIRVILLAARHETVDLVIGLEPGADDYLRKPFDPRELLARLQAVLRSNQWASALHQAPPLSFCPSTFAPATRQLCKGDETIKLTGGEVNLLEALINNSGKPPSRERLLALARDDDEGERNDRAIDIAILRLRRAI